MIVRRATGAPWIQRCTHEEGVGDAFRRRQGAASVEAPIGFEHIAPRPQDPVGVAQDVSLGLEGSRCREVVRHPAVQHADDLGGRMQAHADGRVTQPSRAGVRRLDRHEAFAQVVAELEQIGAAVGVVLPQRIVHPGSPRACRSRTRPPRRAWVPRRRSSARRRARGLGSPAVRSRACSASWLALVTSVTSAISRSRRAVAVATIGAMPPPTYGYTSRDTSAMRMAAATVANALRQVQ